MSGRGAGRINELAILGDWNAICDMCGRRFKASELIKNWKGLMVCPEDWEPRHVLDFFRLPGEKIDVPFARTDPDEVFGEVVTTTNLSSVTVNDRHVVNVISQSEDFSGAPWTATEANTTVTGDDDVAPNGLGTASKIAFDTSDSYRYATVTTPHPSQRWTFSVWVKQHPDEDKTNIVIRLSGGLFDETQANYSLDHLWRRLAVSRTFSSSPSADIVAGFENRTLQTDDDTGIGDEGSILVWGAQLEQSDFATDYVRTVGNTSEGILAQPVLGSWQRVGAGVVTKA